MMLYGQESFLFAASPRFSIMQSSEGVFDGRLGETWTLDGPGIAWFGPIAAPEQQEDRTPLC